MTHSRTPRVVATYAAILLAGVIACAATRVGQTGVGRLQIVHADTAALRRKLDSIADAHHGVVGYSVIDLETARASTGVETRHFPPPA